jgi:hypothetical protein
MNEIFKPIPTWEGMYEVSNLGNIVSLFRNKRLTRKLRLDKDGYLLVTLKCIGREQTIKAHRAVISAFVGSCPDDMEVNHINGVRNDNRLSNLEYVTKSQNHIRAWDTIRDPAKNNFSKITSEIAAKIRVEYLRTHKLKATAEMFGMSKNAVWLIGTGKTWRNA